MGQLEGAVMDKQKKGIYIWSAFFGVSLILLHISIRIYTGDDNYFSTALNTTSFRDYLHGRYTQWSSRVIIEAILAYIAGNYIIWKACNIFMYALWAYSLYKITKSYIGIIMGLTMLYPITDMLSAGWIATSLNYFWPLVLGTYSFVAIQKSISGLRIKWYEIALSVMAEIIAVNMEQYVVLHLFCLGIILVYLLLRKDYTKNKYVILSIHIIVALISLLFILTCPGNNARNSYMVYKWMKDFENLSIFDKLVYAFNTTISGYLSQICLLFLLFVVIIFLCVAKKSKDKGDSGWILPFSSIPILLITIVSIGNVFRNGYFTEISNALSQGEIINPVNWSKPIHYIIFALYVFFTVAIAVSIVYIFEVVLIGSIHGFLFLCSVLVRMVMGFSPTLYASGQRTFCFSYGVILYLIIIVLKESKLLFSEKERRRFEYILLGMGSVFVLEMVTRICMAYGI